MMQYGIPKYRLPSNKLDEDLDVIQSIEIEVSCNSVVGQDIAVADLKNQFDATLVDR